MSTDASIARRWARRAALKVYRKRKTEVQERRFFPER
jgi:hypothetical protein